jgi:hypothetical protein
MDIIAKDLLHKIAKMVVYEVPYEQIAQVLGIADVARVRQLIENEECQNKIQELALTAFEKAETLNDAWDRVEAQSANTVLMALQNNPDADFALRAATVANKAHRRGTFHNKPIEGSAGARAVIELNATFVDKLQQNFSIDTKNETKALEQKETNFLEPARVEQLLRPAPLDVPKPAMEAADDEIDVLFDDTMALSSGT